MTPMSPFLRPDCVHAFDIYTDAVVHLLAERGVDQLSVRAIAHWMGVSPAAVLQQHSKARIIEIVVARFAWRWLEWSVPTYAGPGASDLPASLPLSDEECHGVRVWQALCELARGLALVGDPAAQAQVEAARREEEEQVTARLIRLLGRRPEPRELAAVVALASGLRAELAAAGTTLTGDVAENILRGYVSDLQRAGTRERKP